MSKLSLAALAAAIGISATAVSADTNYFGLQGEQDRDWRIELDLVRADSDATVEIYDLNSGELLGTQMVRAGANADVFVHLDKLPHGDALAVLNANGQVVAEDRILIDRF